MNDKKRDIIITLSMVLISVILCFSVHMKTEKERRVELKKEGLNNKQIDSVIRR